MPRNGCVVVAHILNCHHDKSKLVDCTNMLKVNQHMLLVMAQILLLRLFSRLLASLETNEDLFGISDHHGILSRLT